MMKTLTLEELGAVSGGELSGWRKFVLGLDVVEGYIHGFTLQQIQDSCCDTDEERQFVKDFWNYLHGR